MNIDKETLRKAHQKLEAALEMLEREQASSLYPEVVTFVETAEQLLWSQLRDEACEEVVKTVPVETVKLLRGFDAKTLHDTVRRVAIEGGF